MGYLKVILGRNTYEMIKSGDLTYLIPVIIALLILILIALNRSNRGEWLKQQKAEPSDKAPDKLSGQSNKDHIICEQCGNEWSSENYTDGSPICMACARKNRNKLKSNASQKQSSNESPSATIAPINEELLGKMGTRWLSFWIYLLAIGGIFGILSSVVKAESSANPPVFIILGLAQSALKIVVAIGLSKRRLWAWYINWIIIFMAYIFLSFRHQSSPEHASGELIISLIIYGLVWLLPNYVYWKKRLVLFN